MPRPEDGGPDGSGRLGTALRRACFIASGVLGVIAIWLIVTGSTQKSTTIGALLGCWAILMAAFPVFGSRNARDPGGEVAARPGTAVELATDAAERREHEYRLQQMLRREIQVALGPELSSLRTDIAALRSELVDKVGGQLRLERIETTRVIGSDIEALQHEVRQLKNGSPPAELGGFATTTTSIMQAVDERIVAEPTQRDAPVAASEVRDAVDAGVVDEPVAGVVVLPAPVLVATGPSASAPSASAPSASAPSASAPSVPGAPPHRVVLARSAIAPSAPAVTALSAPESAPDPVVPEPATSPTPEPAGPPPAPTPERARTAPTPEPDAVSAAAPEPEPDLLRPLLSEDPFASLPRIRPFTDFELDPIDDTPEESGYAGRRRQDRGDGAPELSPGRHAGSDQPTGQATDSHGRRRREGPASDDVLARILAREASRR